MESAKIFGSEEECHSCESGWTMYLVSPSHDHDDDDYYCDDGYDHDHHDHHHHEDSDDDSMASDASSGPMEDTSHLKHHHQGVEAVDYGLYLTNQTEKSVLMKKKQKQKQKQKQKHKEVKEEMLFIETRVNNIIHDDNGVEDGDGNGGGDDDDDDDDGSGSGADYSFVGSIKPVKKSKRN